MQQSHEPPLSLYTGQNLKRLHHYFYDLESPSHFIDWNFFFLIASCLGRKVWWGNDFDVYPNIFPIFVGEPGCGKSLPARRVSKILADLTEPRQTKEGTTVQVPLIHISPNSTTLEALWDVLGESTEFIQTCDKPRKFYAHTSVSFCVGEELGTLFKEHTNDLVTFLNEAWDCNNFYRKTRTRGEVKINQMCVNLLGCCTPEWMQRNMKTTLMNEGFAARAVFLWGEEPRKRTTLIRINDEQRESLAELIKHLKVLAKLPPGEVKVNSFDTPEAYKWWDNYVQKKMDRKINPSPRLKHYYGRKKVHMMKLAMIVHFADKTTMHLDVEDFEMASKILEAAEIDMHKALAGQGENPQASIAEDIVKTIKEYKELSEKAILLRFFDRADKEQIEKILQYLVYVGRIVSNGGKYSIQGG